VSIIISPSSILFSQEILHTVISGENKIEEGEIIIDTQHLKNGIYFLRINFEETNYLLVLVK
jgi:hypothetical protein